MTSANSSFSLGITSTSSPQTLQFVLVEAGIKKAMQNVYMIAGTWHIRFQCIEVRPEYASQMMQLKQQIVFFKSLMQHLGFHVNYEYIFL